jgi:hypothetical protein
MTSNPLRLPMATLAALGLAATALATSAAEPGLVADIYLDRPTVLAFVPAAPASADDGDPAFARASAAQALALTGACLGRRPAMYQLVVADRIVLHDGPRTADFDIGGTSPLTGFVLAAPRANPSVLFAGGGPESLAALAPFAAAHYFHLACVP